MIICLELDVSPTNPRPGPERPDTEEVRHPAPEVWFIWGVTLFGATFGANNEKLVAKS